MKMHVRLNGESRTIDMKHLDIRRDVSESEIKKILSRVYEIPANHFKNLVVDRNPDGVVVRPPAVFG